ncbi:MAG TPA: hypothetical protein VGP17_08695 [Solirubrobacteraceae bacterium]|nr:hypothetical protein [Solirubrobacteraceae bacterium]
MKLTLALLARYAEVEPEGGLLNLTGGGLDVFGVPKLPEEFPLAFALRFLYREVEAGQAFQVVLATLDPELQPVGQPTNFEIAPHLTPYHVEGGHGTYAVAGTVMLRVEVEGLHSINITIDGSSVGDIPFQVFLATRG